jgi:hypothetical protein
MGNMNYCKFQNTLSDLADCQRTLEEIFEGGGDEGQTPLSDDELRAAKALIQTCFDITKLVAEQREVPMDELDENDQIEGIMDEAQEVLQENDNG